MQSMQKILNMYHNSKLFSPQDVTINVQTNARERHAVVITGSNNQEVAR